MKLTTELLNSLPAGTEVRDDTERGLIFRVTASGTKSWSLRYVNAPGQHRRKTIGPFPAIGLVRARELARQIKGQVATSVDVVKQEKNAKDAARRAHLNTLSGLFAEYLADAAIGMHRAGKNVRPKRSNTLYQQEKSFRRLIEPTLGDRAVADITRREVMDLVAKKTRLAKSNGSYIVGLMSQLMSYAEMREVIEFSKIKNIPTVPSNKRERVMTDAELRAIWTATEREKFPATSICIRMVLATLQRGGEVCGMEWREIDRKQRLWTIPASRMKNHRQHVVPLSDLAMQLLDEAERDCADRVFVFPSVRLDSRPLHRIALTQAWERIVNDLKLEHCTPHDSRRTGATNLTSERLGFPRFIASMVLSHSASDGAPVVTSVYDRSQYVSPKRQALNAWAALLTEITSGEEPPSNVIQLTARAS